MPLSTLDPARALVTLQRLLEISAGDLSSALIHAANALADALSADKVDAFLYDETRDSLVARGTSTQPLSNLQKNLGLDVLPISNGGRVVLAYQSAQAFRSGNVRDDPVELRGIKEGLKVQSLIGVPLIVGNRLRGVMLIASLQRDYFTQADEDFTKGAASWVGAVAHRAELMEQVGQNALEQGRRSAAEELVTVLAHDVRNYLTPISNRLYLLRHEAQARGNGESVKHAEAALRGVGGLSALVTNLLDVARIDRGLFELDIGAVDLAELAREAGATLSSADHEIIVAASEPVVVSADRVRLRQCLDNLLSNAVSHSPEGAPVNVFMRKYEGDGKAWGRLEVIDEGAGVPQELLPHIFERFVTGRGKRGGMGLGLYLATRIAQAHGGEIVAESPPGKGARFSLCLPLTQLDPDPKTRGSPATA